MAPIVAGMIFLVLLAVGGMTGVLVYLSRAGMLGGGAASDAAWSAVGGGGSATYEIALDPLLVNLADADGHGYLRAGVTLRVQGTTEGERLAKADPASKDGRAQAEVSAPLRDIALDVMGRQQVADLLLPDGKEKLKTALKKAFQDRDPSVKVLDVYFTEFLVQR
jgi:flagellar FliL protein